MRDIPKAKGERLPSKTEMQYPVVRDSKCGRNIEKLDDLLFFDVEAFFSGCYRKRRRVIKKYQRQ